MARATDLGGTSLAEKPPAEEADFELVRRYLAGRDPRAFESLVRRHLPMLRRLLAGLMRGTREDLEDAEQEVLLAVAGGLAGFRFQSSLTTWLYSLARRRALDLLLRGFCARSGACRWVTGSSCSCATWRVSPWRRSPP